MFYGDLETYSKKYALKQAIIKFNNDISLISEEEKNLILKKHKKLSVILEKEKAISLVEKKQLDDVLGSECINWLIKNFGKTEAYASIISNHKKNYENLAVKTSKDDDMLYRHYSSFFADFWNGKISKKNKIWIWFHNGANFDFYFILFRILKIQDHHDFKDFFIKTKTFWVEGKKIYYIKVFLYEKDYYDKKSKNEVIKKKNQTIRKFNRDLKFRQKQGKRLKTTFKEELNEIKIKELEITFRDSALLFADKLADLGESIGFKKGEIEYDFLKEFKSLDDYKNYNNGNDYFYLKQDVRILEEYLNQDFPIPPKLMDLTISTTALNMFYLLNNSVEKIKDSVDEAESWFLFKRAYAGGHVTVNPKYQLKLLEKVNVFDINSLYPFIMKTGVFPTGKGKSENDDEFKYKYYRVNIKYAKTNYTPVFTSRRRQISNGAKYMLRKHLGEVSEDQKIDMIAPYYPDVLENETMIMGPFQLSMLEKYYTGSWKKDVIYNFKQETGSVIFREYIDFWNARKEKDTLEGNEAARNFDKLMMNSLSGKMAQTIYNDETTIIKKTELISFLKEISEDESDPESQIFNTEFKLKYTDSNLFIEVFNKTTNLFIAKIQVYNLGDYFRFTLFRNITNHLSYIPIAQAITEQARSYLQDTAAPFNGYEVYRDTDSLHLLNKKLPKHLLHDSKIGKWKFEEKVRYAAYRRSKHYLHEDIWLVNKNKHKDFKITGGGMNVAYFNNKDDDGKYPISKEIYLKDKFTVSKGKTHKIKFEDGILFYDANCSFTMPDYFYEYKNIKQ